MNCPPTGNEEGLVGYWNFEEGSGTTAYDQTANGNDGAINGATYNTNVPSQSCALTNINGCDSTAVLNLTINYGDTSYTNITACDSVVWNGTTYTQSGTYSYSGASNNYSMNFDGVDDYVDLPELDISNGNEVSLSLWIYTEDITTNPTYALIKHENSIQPDWMLQFQTEDWGKALEFGTLTSGGYNELEVSINSNDFILLFTVLIA